MSKRVDTSIPYRLVKPNRKTEAKYAQIVMDSRQVREYLRDVIFMQCGSLEAYAVEHKVSRSFISAVLIGYKAIPQWMQEEWGVRKIVQEAHWVRR